MGRWIWTPLPDAPVSVVMGYTPSGSLDLHELLASLHHLITLLAPFVFEMMLHFVDYFGTG